MEQSCRTIGGHVDQWLCAELWSLHWFFRLKLSTRVTVCGSLLLKMLKMESRRVYKALSLVHGGVKLSSRCQGAVQFRN